MTSQLSPSAFAEIVRLAPLVSIDLIVCDRQARVLLGRRTNPPALGWWFVPGGRILKEERLAQAASRLVLEELGYAGALAPRLRGIFEHFYPDNFQGTEAFGTHYVVLAYDLDLEPELLNPPLRQHAAYRWWAAEELLASPDVHAYTKDYFRPPAGG